MKKQTKKEPKPFCKFQDLSVESMDDVYICMSADDFNGVCEFRVVESRYEAKMRRRKIIGWLMIVLPVLAVLGIVLAMTGWLGLLCLIGFLLVVGLLSWSVTSGLLRISE